MATQIATAGARTSDGAQILVRYAYDDRAVSHQSGQRWVNGINGNAVEATVTAPPGYPAGVIPGHVIFYLADGTEHPVRVSVVVGGDNTLTAAEVTQGTDGIRGPIDFGGFSLVTDR